MQPQRTKDRDADATRAVLLAAAEEEFAQKGFSGARIDEIAARAGYNKSLIFQYFTSKMGLYHAVISCAKGDMTRRFDLTVMAAVANDATVLTAQQVRDVISHGLTYTFDHLHSHPNVCRILAWEAAEGWETYRALPDFTGTVQTKFANVADFLRRAQAAGLVRQDADPINLIVQYLSMALTHFASLPRFETLYPEHDFRSDTAIAQARDDLIRFVLHGTLTPEGLGDFDETGI